jgi:hypothetical protein
MSVIANARQRQMEHTRQQEFIPVREGLSGYLGDEAGFREAHAIRPVRVAPQPRLPNRVLSPEQARQLQADEEARLLQEQMIMNEANRPQMIRR